MTAHVVGIHFLTIDNDTFVSVTTDVVPVLIEEKTIPYICSSKEECFLVRYFIGESFIERAVSLIIS